MRMELTRSMLSMTEEEGSKQEFNGLKGMLLMKGMLLKGLLMKMAMTMLEGLPCRSS